MKAILAAATLMAALVVQSRAQLPPTAPDPVCVPAAIQASPILRNDKGQVVPRPLQNARAAGVLPEKLPTNIVLDLEGATYAWLYRQIFNLLGWAPCGLVPQFSLAANFPWCLAQPGFGTFPTAIPFCAPTLAQQAAIAAALTGGVPTAVGSVVAQICAACKATPYPTPEGWQQLEVLKVTANYANQPAQVPIGAVLKPAASNTDTKQLVVVLRGAAFKGDSAYSDDYAQVSAGAYGAGAIHSGYKNMADQIWGALAAVLDAEIVNGTGAINDILIGGHSVGGGLGMLLSTRIQSYLSEKCAPELGKCTGFPSRTNPQVSLVTFGAVNVGDAAYVQDFNKRVNARIIDFEKDRTKQFLLTRYPFFVPDLSPVPVYARVGGEIILTAEEMPFQPEVWGAISDPGANLSWRLNEQAFISYGIVPVTIAQGIPQPRGQVYTSSTHVCSYMCKLSTYLQGPAPKTWCLLDADVQLEGAATYCSEFAPYAFAKVFPLQGDSQFP